MVSLPSISHNINPEKNIDNHVKRVILAPTGLQALGLATWGALNFGHKSYKDCITVLQGE